INTQKGLSHDNVKAIIQDKEGLLWFGTQDGLNMYDGYDITIFKPDPASGINISFIGVLMEDDNDQIWIGTEGYGVVLFDLNTRTFKQLEYKSKYNLNSKKIKSMAMNDTMAWFAIDTKGLVTYNKKNKNLFLQKKLHDNLERSSSLYLLNDHLWIGTWGQGLFKHDIKTRKTEQVQLKKHHNQIISNKIHSITKYSDDVLVVSNWGKGLITYDITSGTKDPKINTFTVENGFNNALTRQIIVRNNNIWTAGDRGLTRIIVQPDNNYKIFKIFKGEQSNKLNDNYANTICFDRTGNLWCGTVNGGVNKLVFDKKKFELYNKYFFTNNFNPQITFIHPISDDVFLSGPDLKKIDLSADTCTHFRVKISKDKYVKNVLSMKQFRIQNKWLTFIGTRHNGLVIIDGSRDLSEKYSTVRIVKGFGHDLYDYLLDDKGHVWLGSKHNLYVLQFDTLSKKPLKRKDIKIYGIKGLKRANKAKTKCFYQRDNGEIWIGTLNGLIRLHSYKDLEQKFNDFTYYTSRDTTGKARLLCNGIECIFEDSKQNIWLGTFGGGIALFNPDKDSFTYFNKKDGLLAENIYSIEEQKDKHILWLGTNRGIVRFDPSTNDAGKFKSFTTDDGLQGLKFQNNASYVNSRGQIIFGGPNGFNRFHPKKMSLNKVPPPPLITNITIYNRYKDEGEYTINIGSLPKKDGVPYLELDYKNYAFKISFSVPSYTKPLKNQYLYKLTGYDTKWRHADAMHRSSDYSNLPYRKYAYYLKASNSDGVWSEGEAKLMVNLIPPFWERIWFRIAVILLVAIIVYTVYTIRVRTLTARQKHLELVVDQRTKDLKDANKDLQIQKEEILTQNEEIQQQNEEIQTQRDAIMEQKGQIENSFKRLEVLSEFGQKLTSTLNIDSIHEMMYQYAKSVVDIHSFGIGLVIDERNSVVFTHFIEEGKTLEPFDKSLDDKSSLSAWCIKNQKPIFINDIENEYHQYVDQLDSSNSPDMSKSRILLPLTVKDKRIGILVVHSPQMGAFKNADLTNMQTLASYTSIALDNARAYELINSKNMAIKESITYAQSIQNAFMPTSEKLNKYFDSFTLFKPKDIVSGDFTWFSPIESDEQKPLKAFACVADCTGHGVPGALISMIGNNLLHENINIRQERNPAVILDKVNSGFQLALQQESTGNNDGMDLALVYLENVGSEYKLSYAGAKNPCVVFRANTGELEILKASRRSIGGLRSWRSKLPFQKVDITLSKNDVIYLFSDGIIDQHNLNRDRFSRERFFELIKSVATLDMPAQKEKLETALQEHMINEKQTDDISVMGIRLR
ncbi:MAG: SpoIIE family protein phosphatase, partial [Bacteroidales bacterium]|nr:SpoIIE family protein phosphatase [Bacteroidales bacterium]